MSNNLFETDIDLVEFVNPAANDYRLQSTSAAVDAGTNLAAYGVVLDYAGLARPGAGITYDIGAYEFGGLMVAAAVWLPLILN